MSLSDSITPNASPPSPHLSSSSTPFESVTDQVESDSMADETDPVFIASEASSVNDTDNESIISTSEVDWSRVRTRAQSVISDGSDDESGITISGEEESYDVITPSHSLSLQSVPSRATGTSGSTMSLEDAQSSIDAFFTNRVSYTSNQSNKLRFWQALCVEFGLVDMSSNPLPSFSDLEIITEDSESETASTGFSNTRSRTSSISEFSSSQIAYGSSSGPSASTRSKRKGKKNKNLPPLPTSLTAAKQLLATKAHVNLKDYFQARHEARNTSKKENVVKRPAENFAHLVHPSRRALVNYTMETGKFVKKGKAKNEWLNPMLTSMD